jgi:hypothetical protein
MSGPRRPIRLKVYKPTRVNWKPAVWWSPGQTHIRPVPGVTLTIPRRLWPARRDGYRVCYYCGETKWMEGGANMACYECARTLACMRNHVKGPPWWPERLRSMYEQITGEKWTQ